ncbi:hypothetical protein [Colwellia sp. C1TZA3]|uniref:hypothetical protein n=1 Tax=Colwellia sp. C1TZA3 TaxID=2508879 RepID=UPI0017487238|nr:hypothetical protein [Colwellia sp. C1TZA3]
MVILLSLYLFIADAREKIANAEITRQQLSFLETLDLFTDTDERLVQLLADGNNEAWLHLAKHHGDSNANTAYQLAEYFRRDEQITSAQLWYQVAIRQQHVAARIALANIYFKQQQYVNIKPLLLPIAGNEKALALLYKVALYQGELAFIEDHKNMLAQGGNVGLYNELEHFAVFSDSQRQSEEKLEQHIEKKTNKNLACSVDVQLFATSLKGLRHGQQLMSAFAHHKLAKYICLRTPKYISEKAINCLHGVSENISCNASVWITRNDITSRYLGVIVEQGGANVDHGIMYIDQDDNLDVLIHELSHFIGFVDEYPLPKQHQKCQQVQQSPFAHNLVVLADFYLGEREKLRASILSQVPWRNLIKPSTPILSKYQQGWTLATPVKYQNEIGLFTTASCNKQRKTQAFKPLSSRTKLEYFELYFPERYLNIIELAPKLFLMPSYYFNLRRDLAY